MKKMRHLMWSGTTAAVMGLTAALVLGSVGTAFTYQGQLKDGGIPADGDYDFVFQLHDDPSLDSQVGSDYPVNDWHVSDGLFTVELDFGSVFTGDALWLQVSVRPGDSTGAYTDLSPRQPLNAAPYALYALDAGSAGFWATSGIDIYNTNSGNVGIGTTTPAAALQVTNDGSSPAIWAESSDVPLYAYRTSTTGTSPAIQGDSDSATPNASGIAGTLTSTTPGSGSAAVRGINNGTGGAGAGVWGSQDGSGVGVHGTVPDGTAVLGAASGTSGTNYGVRGRSWSPDGYGVQGDCSLGTGVYGIGGATSGVNYGVRGQTNSPDGYAGYFTGGQNYFEGNVGIGVENPSYPLDVGADASGHGICTAGQVLFNKAGTALRIRHELGGGAFHSTQYDGSYINSVGAPVTSALHLNGASTGDVLIAGGGGNVGIGVENPGYPLDVGADASGHGICTAGQVLFNKAGTALIISHAYPGEGYTCESQFDGNHVNSTGSGLPFTPALELNSASSGNVLLANGGGNVGIGWDAPAAALDVRGNVIIRSASTDAVLIELGEGLDYAEGFDVSDESQITPGTVLVIDAEHAGQLAMSNSPYDRKVAGIVAGANGLGSAVRLGVGQYDFDVALAGRVYCNVDATYGAVQPGDLLTTSPTPGCAMKVADHERAQGAILGKAMQPLKSGEKGQILVLVTLQ